MINRSTLMPNAISAESLQKFFRELANRSDSPLLVPSLTTKFTPLQISLLTDCITLWEAEKWRFLTMADNARLNPTTHVFPNSQPASILV